MIYLGGLDSVEQNFLSRYQVKHVLTLDSESPGIPEIWGVRHKFIQVQPSSIAVNETDVQNILMFAVMLRA